MTKSGEDTLKIMAGVIVVVLGVAYGIYRHVSYKRSATTVRATVTDKERITETDGDGGTTSKYLVFTDKETFENTDTWAFGKYNSSDIQGRLRRGRTYDVLVAGWRRPRWSQYRNVISIVGEVPTDTELEVGK